jgi:hypothetical protein
MKPVKPLFVVGLLLVGACGASVNSMARHASRAAIDEGAEEIGREDTQETLKEAAKDPDIQAATRAMTDQIAAGVLQALASDSAHAQLATTTKTITQSAVQQLVASLGSAQTRAQLVGLTNAVTEAAMQQVARSLQTDLRPAVRDMSREDLGQGMAAALHTQLQPALGATAQNVAYNAVLGVNDGLGRAWTGSDGLSADLREREWHLPSILWVALAAMALVTLMLIAGAVMMVARARRARAEVARLEHATLLLATAMRNGQASPQNDELLGLVQHALGRHDRSGQHRVDGMDADAMRKSG